VGRFTDDDIRANRDHFAEKLRAYRQKMDAIHKVKNDAGHPYDFLFVDVRAREAFNRAHIPGALCAPATELTELAAQLPRDRELVVYCWSHF
jgi:rhodanese-related sulfurtransferase